MNATHTHKLNVMVNGNRVSETTYPAYAAMMDAARSIRDEVAANNPDGFIVAQSQAMGPHGWYHLAILS